jgi:hypothetical protein
MSHNASSAAVLEAYAPVVALRLAAPDERHLLQRLAALDDAPPLDGRVLLALVDGEAVAALSLYDGRVVANPFRYTESAIELLRLRARHLSARRPARRFSASGHAAQR